MSSVASCEFGSTSGRVGAGPDLPIGYIGLSLGPQDPRGAPANCGTHKVNCRYMVSSINIRQKFMSSLFMKLSFIDLIRFRVDNARVFQRVSMNLNMTVGEDTCRLYCSVVILKALRLRPAFGESYRLLRVNQAK